MLGKGVTLMAIIQKKIISPKLPDCLLTIVLFLTLIGLLNGCASIKKFLAPKKETVAFAFETGAETNNGKPVYVVIRTVNKKKFLTQSYDQIADMVYADPPVPSLLAWHMLLPGKKEKIQVEKPEEAAIGVYVLFTQPGMKWKIMLKEPFEKKYDIVLLKNSLQ